VRQRRLPTRAHILRIPDRRGLSAGRKKPGSENHDKQSNDVPGASDQDRGRDRERTCSSSGARTLGSTLGTIDGKHIASPTRAPDLNPTRNEGRTVAEPDQARHGPNDFIRV
jgi:hypothetical protein